MFFFFLFIFAIHSFIHWYNYIYNSFSHTFILAFIHTIHSTALYSLFTRYFFATAPTSLKRAWRRDVFGPGRPRPGLARVRAARAVAGVDERRPPPTHCLLPRVAQLSELVRGKCAEGEGDVLRTLSSVEGPVHAALASAVSARRCSSSETTWVWMVLPV